LKRLEIIQSRTLGSVKHLYISLTPWRDHQKTLTEIFREGFDLWRESMGIDPTIPDQSRETPDLKSNKAKIRQVTEPLK
jgi:hypothetical protein